MTTERGLRKERIGTVVSDKMDKTAVVAVVQKYKHPLYKKTVSKTKKYKVHDENNDCGIGDTVLIQETRHYSKDKYFRLVEIVEKAK
jgi:small subunit ribosomal protein S17